MIAQAFLRTWPRSGEKSFCKKQWAVGTTNNWQGGSPSVNETKPVRETRCTRWGQNENPIRRKIHPEKRWGKSGQRVIRKTKKKVQAPPQEEKNGTAMKKEKGKEKRAGINSQGETQQKNQISQPSKGRG